MVVAWLSLGLICSLALYTAERGINAAIAEPFDALWSAVGAITTAGSDLFPITIEGRLAAMVLTVVGVFLYWPSLPRSRVSCCRVQGWEKAVAAMDLPASSSG